MIANANENLNLWEHYKKNKKAENEEFMTQGK